jgi:hypothetical protein
MESREVGGKEGRPGPVPESRFMVTGMTIFSCVLRTAVPALAVVPILAGCATEHGAAQPPAGIAPSSAATKTTTQPTTTVTAPPTAANGTDYATCASGSCEVAVSGPVDIRFGGAGAGTLSITSVGPGGVDFNLNQDAGESANGTLKPGCGTASFAAAGGMSGTFGSATSDSTSCLHQWPAAEPDAVTLQMPAVIGNTAILRIVIG